MHCSALARYVASYSRRLADHEGCGCGEARQLVVVNDLHHCGIRQRRRQLVWVVGVHDGDGVTLYRALEQHRYTHNEAHHTVSLAYPASL